MAAAALRRRAGGWGAAVERGLSGLAVRRRDCPMGAVEDVLRVHPAAYVERVRAAVPREGWAQLDGDTFLSPGSYDAAMRAVGGICAAVDAVVTGGAKTAFVAGRPPGHHAERETAMGFCLFANAAIAANYARDKHGAERIAKTLEVDPADLLSAWLNRYRDWYQENVVTCRWTEQRVVSNQFGYAGTADLLIEHKVHGLCLVDIKTQKVKPGAKASAYKSWSYQLAAYRKALGVEARCINLIVNSVAPETPIEHVWGEAEMDAGLHAFLAARELWVIEKGYDPREAARNQLVLTA